MEPVQRIPRYTLLFRQMIKQMPAQDPQRSKLLEADELASKIASAEVDETTKRASMMYLLKTSIDNFPDGLWSNSRKFIDCIDVLDHMHPGMMDGPGTPGGSAGGLIHCSLLLFDDKLVLVKRLHPEKSARNLAGLDELEKVATKVKSMTAGSKKQGMSYRGMVEITDLMATDNGGAGWLTLGARQ
jgi:protein ECT2